MWTRRREAVTWVLVVAAAVVVGLELVDPLRRSDFMVFVQAGSDVAHGRNPYTSVDDPFLWGGSAYVYPYLTAFFFVPFAWLPFATADVAWYLLSVAAVVGGCRALGLRDPIGIVAILVSATCIRSLQVGALNALLFAGLALMWRHRDRMVPVAVSFALLAGAKLLLLPMALWVLLSRPRGTVVASAAAAGGFLGLGLLLAPVSPVEFVRATALLAEHEGPHSMSVLRWAPDAAFLPVLLGGAVLLLGAIWRLRWSREGQPVLFVACLVGSLLMTPIYWSHYTLLLAAGVLVASPTRRAALLFCAATWVILPPVGAWRGFELSMGTRIGLLYCLMAAAVLGAALRRDGQARIEPIEEQRVAEPAQA